jgi:pSer/pThr/pTyr-binding forkhead associated (FHA) protein
VPIGKYTVGRHQLAPHDKYLSRDHLTVRCGNGRLVLSDARAKNPTWINGQTLRGEVAIQPGNTVRLGASRGQFRR